MYYYIYTITITYTMTILLQLQYYYNNIYILHYYKMFQKNVQKGFSIKDKKSPCSRIKRFLTQGSGKVPYLRIKNFPFPKIKKVQKSSSIKKSLLVCEYFFFNQKRARLLLPKSQIV